MTKSTANGQETIKFGTIEKWVCSIVAGAFVIGIGYIICLTLENNKALAESNTKQALIEYRLTAIEAQLRAVKVNWEGM